MSTAEAVAVQRPILFSGSMVRAILEGRKTQTRRVLKIPVMMPYFDMKFTLQPDGEWLVERWPRQEREMGNFGRCERIACPYGKVGDRLWVRETFQPLHTPDMYPDWKTGRGYSISYLATEGRREYQDWNTDSMTDRLHPAIFMPRWASRITLEITKVRVERVQEITAHDAICEGITGMPKVPGVSHEECRDIDIGGFHELWDKINSKRGFGWEKNPWVWVIEFKRVNP